MRASAIFPILLFAGAAIASPASSQPAPGPPIPGPPQTQPASPAPTPIAPNPTAPNPTAAPAPAQTSDLAPQPLTYVQVLAPDALRAVQERLHATGTFTGQVDGNWGADSQAALERFQQSSGLQVTGQLNQATVTVLGINPATLVATAPVSPPAPSSPPQAHQVFALSDGSIRLIQGRLRSYGFYYGGVDGEWGSGTQVAMQNFQQARGIPVTDRLNAATVTALGLDPASMIPAQ